MVKFEKAFGKFASHVSRIAGSPFVFCLAMLLILVWGSLGPYYEYSDTWQEVINTLTTIITFLMIFVIQNSQNRDSAAIQAKLDELIQSSDARNDFMGIEEKTHEEIVALKEKQSGVS